MTVFPLQAEFTMEDTMHPLKFYTSPNGDRWLLARDTEQEALVLHQANAPSGGALTRIAIAEFLNGNSDAPERRALLRLIGRLVGDTPAADNDVAKLDRRDDVEEVAVSR